MTATARFDTAPSMHQNRIESEENYRQSLRVLDPFFTPAAAQAPSGEEAVAAMGADAEPAPIELPQPPSPPPSSVAAADLHLLAPQAEDTRWSAPEANSAPPPLPGQPSSSPSSPPLLCLPPSRG